MSDNNTPAKYTVTGGGSVGWFRASWPLVTLTATAERLQLEYPGKTVVFTPEEVISIDIIRPFPFIVRYLAIRHIQAETPKRVRFASFDGADRLMEGIEESGFVTRG